MMNIDLAGVSVCLDLPAALIGPQFKSFEIDSSASADVIVQLADASSLEDLPHEEYAEYDTSFSLTRIGAERIRTYFHDVDGWIGLSVTGNKVLCVPEEGLSFDERQAFALFDLMKGGVFLQLRKHGVFVLHSSSLVHEGKVYAFSALSGVGKTTHTELLRNLYGLRYYNGDMIAVKAGEVPVKVHGLPWSGESGIFTAESLPFGGLFFLRRADANFVEPVNGLPKLVELTQRMLSVNYSHSAFAENCAMLQKTAEALPCAVLNCLPDEEAARVSFAYINQHMSQ